MPASAAPGSTYTWMYGGWAYHLGLTAIPLKVTGTLVSLDATHFTIRVADGTITIDQAALTSAPAPATGGPTKIAPA